ncbi:Activator of Hsp90 ATPase 1 family protein [Paenibacillus curdlanolyticus YK9]|uniref:Activator of Hsp90 ATPase 1 family protein n=1 Tax=Paenibacillus curdlanolyticus YK9 TaxID=717606 RepID=E0I641_9BACL|nr:SRPBCC domain-containing protein [Paenibacillus curdlanolyticus]EFM12433.1 Activator of Hsp90 ATPase 1 family protein [Paenibacillus curdlanolyticus YK9]
MDQQTVNQLPDIVQTIVLNAPIDKVWNAVATAEGIGAWFMPNNFQPIVGFEFELNAGQWGNSPCKVTEIDPPNGLAFTWGRDWTLRFQLVAQGDQTEFTLTHSGWSAEGVTEFGEPHAIVRDRMNGGWVGLVKKLSGYVQG